MADDTSTTDAPATGDVVVVPVDLGDAGKQAIDRMKAERDEARKEAKANAGAATRLAALEESQKSEAQKLADERDAIKVERDALLSEAMRSRVALTKGLDPQLVDRLRGATEDELSEDADRLLELVKPSGPPRFGAVDQGVRQSTPPADAGEREVARALFGTP